MPIWLIILIILISISLISNFFSWIGEHIVPICLTVVVVVALVFLGVYAIPLFVVAFVILVMLGKSKKKETKVSEEKKESPHEEEVSALDTDADAKEVILRGYAYVDALRSYNDKIPNEKMSGELEKLEKTVATIMDEVKKNPEKTGKVRKMMDYYLPTIDGILSRYADYDTGGVYGKNIENTKKNVSDTMETINKGFEGILNGLYSDDAMDINADLVVLKQMLEGDGLIDL